MVKITVIGWYGTETIGDRAIFAGLCSLFDEAYGDFEIRLGAIYPFFSERTLYEDMDFLCYCARRRSLNISLFDTRVKKELDNAIRNGDILVMGGGPFADMDCMFMVEYAFATAKKLRKKTMVLGCGVGPLKKRRYERSLIHIMSNSDITIFRDDTSRQEYERILGHKSTTGAAIDPAVFTAILYKEGNVLFITKNDQVIASVMGFLNIYKISDDILTDDINKTVIEFIRRLQTYNKQIHLLPMSYFSGGTDDRVFMNHIKNIIGSDTITVQNMPLNLHDTLEQFSSAAMCVGMRFHSVLLQTILNGNNVILDYTDPSTGKIGNFIRQLRAADYYRNKYAAIQTSDIMPALNDGYPFEVDTKLVSRYRDTYITAMRSIPLE